MTVSSIIASIHDENLEVEVYSHLSTWLADHYLREVMENCELRSSLSLIKKFNDAKYHHDIISTITDGIKGLDDEEKQ